MGVQSVRLASFSHFVRTLYSSCIFFTTSRSLSLRRADLQETVLAHAMLPPIGRQLKVTVRVIITIKFRIIITVVEGVFVEWFVTVHVVMNAFHFISHLQIEAIRDLTGDVVEASHKALKVFHVDCLHENYNILILLRCDPLANPSRPVNYFLKRPCLIDVTTRAHLLQHEPDSSLRGWNLDETLSHRETFTIGTHTL
jgi:hypothetical protein